MKDQWYCSVDGQEYGPFTWEQMRGMVAEGRLVAESQVRRASDKQWFAASQIPSLIDRPQLSSAAQPSARTKTRTPRKTVERYTSTKPPRAEAESMPAGTATSTESSTNEPRPAPSETSPGSSSSFRLQVQEPPVGPPPVPASAESPSGIAIKVAPPSPTGSSRFAAAKKTNGAAPKPEKSSPAKSAQSAMPAKPPSATSKKQQEQMMVLVALGFACAILLVGMIGVLMWAMRDMSEPAKKLATTEEFSVVEEPAPDPKPAAPVETPAEAEPPAEAVAAAPAEPVATEPPPAELAPPAEPVDPAVAAAKKVIADQKSWTRLDRSPGVRLSNQVTVRITNVWLASDLDGTFVEPPLPASLQANAAAAPADGSSPPEEPAKPDEAAAGDESAVQLPKYVFVRIELTNSAAIPRRFKGWNTVGSTVAVLADDADHVLPLVSPEITQETKRLADVLIKPGEMVVDTLIFAAPGKPVERLRLALDNAQLETTGRFAREIPLEVMFKKPSDEEPLTVQGDPDQPGEKPDPDGAPPAAPGLSTKDLIEFENQAKKEGKEAIDPPKNP